MRWPRRPEDPNPGTCDGGTFVECCTDDSGMSSCTLTDLGRWSPGARAYLAWVTPTDHEPDTLDRVADFAKEYNPLAYLERAHERVSETIRETAPELAPKFSIDIDADNLAIVMAALGAGALYVWSRK